MFINLSVLMLRQNLRNLNRAQFVVAHNTVTVKWTEGYQLHTKLGEEMSSVFETVESNSKISVLCVCVFFLIENLAITPQMVMIDALNPKCAYDLYS